MPFQLPEKLLAITEELFQTLPMTKKPTLAAQLQAAHNEMRNVDGLQPQEALDELLKYLFFKEYEEKAGHSISFVDGFVSELTGNEVAACIRRAFQEYSLRSLIAPRNWGTDGFLLSDMAIVKVHSIFQGSRLTELGLDLRSSALREFISGPIRKGLGIFLTPDDVVRAVVAAIAPSSVERILDPACGSGTFLAEVAKYIEPSETPLQIYGIDKSPRMLLLADFNCGHLGNIEFNRASCDSLAPIGSADLPSWFRPDYFDIILTNPPFGVTVDARGHDFAAYTTCLDETGYPVRSQGSEIMFVERCLDLLRPGGKMGIVLPRSVLTNNRLQLARERLGRLGAVRVVISLPHETFAATGTQTTTTVLIIEKYGLNFSVKSRLKPVLARIDNVGFDSTGRLRAGSQLDGLGDAIRAALDQNTDGGRVQILNEMTAGDTFAMLARILSGQTSETDSALRTIGDLVETAAVGRTPARSSYANRGVFLVKVGNLTGAGINWIPRDRNFISSSDKYCRNLSAIRLLRSGDLVLTSSAHASRYIAKKVDIVTSVPQQVGGVAAFVGEVMALRPKADLVDPFLLLAYLRCPSVVSSIQDRVRGQTAHLHPSDLSNIALDETLLAAPQLAKIADLLREEAEINDRLNVLSFSQSDLHEALGEEASISEMAAE